MNKDALFSSDKKYWETPQALFDKLNNQFHFTLDAAVSHDNHKCARYFTEETDGLRQDWGGRQFFAIPLMEQKKLENGRGNVMKKLKSLTPQWCF